MIILGILCFVLLVIVHELGHFLVAKRNGVEVEEFGIGFPPRLFGKKYGETLYSVNLLPLGGFVKLKGETDSDKRPGSFGVASIWSKAKILLAGVGMNILATIVIIFVLALTQLPNMIPGQYQIPANQTVIEGAPKVAQVVEESAAAGAGIKPGDEIVSINDNQITSGEQLSATTEKLAGEEVEISLRRSGDIQNTTAVLGTDEEGGYLGVAPIESSRYTWAAPLVAVGLTLQMIGLVLGVLWDIVTGLLAGAGSEAAQGVAGPVGIIVILQNLSDFGLAFLFMVIASISVSLAVFNALPIPALDGGRLAVIVGARTLKKQLTEKVENSIHAAGFLSLIALLILITYVDIQRFL